MDALTSWDPDGAGPTPAWLIASGENLFAGDVAGATLLAHDGSQWLGLGFPVSGTGVKAMTVFNGELVVAGEFSFFTTAGPVATNVARWNGTVWRALGSGVNDNVRALAVHNGELVAAGEFTVAGGVAAAGVARWNGAVWSGLGSGIFTSATAGPFALASFGGSLYVGGTFQIAVSGGAATNLARWNGTTWSAAGNPNGTVRALAVRSSGVGNSLLFAGGLFSAIGGVAAANVAMMSLTSGWSALGTGLPTATVIALVVRNIGLFFEVVAVLGSSTLRVWNGTTWSALVQPGQMAALALTLHGGQYVVGGNSREAVQTLAFGAAAWQPLLGHGIASAIHALVFVGEDLVAGGEFASIDGVAVNGIARRSGTVWTGLGSGVQGGDATVRALARLPNGDLVAGGDFTAAGGTPASNVARWNGSAWSAIGSGTNGTVLSLLRLANGDLLAGGEFTMAGGITVNRVARRTASSWQPLGTGIDGDVHALALLPNGDVIAGGEFTTAGGVACENIARWNGSTWSPVGPGLNDIVHSLCVLADGTFLAGGRFTATASGSFAVLGVARWNGQAWLSLGTALAGIDARALALLELPDRDVLAGGRFQTAGGQTVNNLARFGDQLWSALGTGVAVIVHAMAASPSGVIAIGGDMFTANGLASGHLAFLTSSCAALATSYGAGCSGAAGPLGLTATQLPWAGGTFTGSTTGIAPTAIAVAVFGFQQLSIPISAVLPQGLPGCMALAAPDLLALVASTPSGAVTQLAIPALPSLAGAQLFHQVVSLQLGAGGAITGIASSNGIVLTVGVL